MTETVAANFRFASVDLDEQAEFDLEAWLADLLVNRYLSPDSKETIPNES